MTRYMCLVSGEDFDTKEEAESHAQNKHNLTLHDAIHKNELFVELDDDADPEEVYREHVEN